MNNLVFCVFLLGVLSSTAHAYVTKDDANKETNRPDAVHIGGVEVSTGSVYFNKIGNIKSCPVKPWTAEQTADREKSKQITFDVEYYKPPTVIVWLTRLDCNYKYNTRFVIEASDVTTTGCVIHFKTWCNTWFASSIVSYQAIGIAA